ncbi:MAG: RHS repeat domain-containing protein, partial [Flammeovirgaceae bacterium]
MSDIVAGADYYPFGLPIPERELTREPYRYGYQGQYSEKDKETGFNFFDLRMYDARIGRWVSPDPYGQFSSCYVGMGNMPNMGTDPNGGWSFDFGRALGFATLGAVIGGTLELATSNGDGMRGAAIGFAAGFIGGSVNWSKAKLPKVGLGKLYAKAGDFVDFIDLSEKALNFSKNAMTAIARRAADLLNLWRL